MDSKNQSCHKNRGLWYIFQYRFFCNEITDRLSAPASSLARHGGDFFRTVPPSLRAIRVSRSERRGLHLTLVVIACWLLWTCLFFGLARAVQASALEHGVVPASWSDIKGEGTHPSKYLYNGLSRVLTSHLFVSFSFHSPVSVSTAVVPEMPCRIYIRRKPKPSSSFFLPLYVSPFLRSAAEVLLWLMRTYFHHFGWTNCYGSAALSCRWC